MIAGRAAAAAMLATAVVVVGVAGSRLEALVVERDPAEKLLYLPNGKYLELASVGQAPLVADAIYLWAIQFYSNYEREDRLRYVEHVFSNVITELDPHFIDAYWLGAMILGVESGDLEASLSLLDKGHERNPDTWILPYLAGWECYFAQQPERAAVYFDRAAGLPGAPLLTRRMQAGMLSRTGDLRDALRLWIEVLEDPDADSASISIARRKVRELKLRIDLSDLQAAVGAFRDDNGRTPLRLEELVRRGYVRSVPRDPDDEPYVYDPATGTVSSRAGRVLGES